MFTADRAAAQPPYGYYGYGNGMHDFAPHWHQTNTLFGSVYWYGNGPHDFRPHDHGYSPWGGVRSYSYTPYGATKSYNGFGYSNGYYNYRPYYNYGGYYGPGYSPYYGGYNTIWGW
jgi:hypothetical protein